MNYENTPNAQQVAVSKLYQSVLQNDVITSTQ